MKKKVKDNDAKNKALALQLKQLTLDQLADKKKMKKHFEATLRQAENLFLEKEAQLLETNKHLMQELSDLSQFKKMRHHLSMQLEATKQTIESNELQHQKQLHELKERFEAARARLEKEADDRIAHSRQLYKEEVGKELDVDSRRIRRENKMMEREYLFHKKTTKELQQTAHRLEINIKNLKKELQQTQEKDEEHARKGLRQTQLINELKKKKTQLQQGISTVEQEGKEGRIAKKQLQTSITKELALEAKSLEDQSRLKTKELENVKAHARTILEQRNEVEKLFLKSLERVKEDVQMRRLQQYSEAMKLYESTVDNYTLAPYNSSGKFDSGLTTAPPPKPPQKEIIVKDLSAKDKTQVLTLLVKSIFRSLAASSHMGCPPFLTEKVQSKVSSRRRVSDQSAQMLQLGWSRPDPDRQSAPSAGPVFAPDNGSFFITDDNNDLDDIM